jgi:FKBP-type peptidyl-prolyl cis-trans isomerase
MLGVDKFIKGLTEGLQLMKEGSKWILYIPSDLAYGGRGTGRGKGAKTAPKAPLIGPNQTLIFEVELISMRSKE